MDRVRDVEGTAIWRTPRVLSTLASAFMFTLGLSLWLVGSPEVAQVASYAVTINGLRLFRKGQRLA